MLNTLERPGSTESARDLTHDPALDETPMRRTPAPKRVVGIDIARAFALIGMFTQHVVVGDDDGNTSTGLVGWFFRESAGRASVLFFVLSGVSLSLIARSGRRTAAPAALRRRGFLLLTGGILLTASVWTASILQHYGVAFLLAPWLLRLGRRGLGVVTAAGLIGGPIAMLWLPTVSGDITRWWSGTTGTWLTEQVWDLLVSGIYPMVIWIGFFALGMLVGRLDLDRGRVRRTLVAVGIASTLALGVAAVETTEALGGSAASDAGVDDASATSVSDDSDAELSDPFENLTSEELEALTEKEFDAMAKQSDAFYKQEFGDGPGAGADGPVDWRSLTDTTGHSGKLGWTLQTSSIAVAVLGLCLFVRGRAATMLYPLAALGSMSLTAYLLHIALVNDVWDSRFAEQGWSVIGQEWAFAGLVALMTATCVVFHRLWGAGPFERLLKHFTIRSGNRCAGDP